MSLLLNTDFLVVVSFVLFFAVLYYFKVHMIVGDMLDARADRIRSELDEARSLRDEAQALLASYERKQNDVEKLAEEIVAKAAEDARLASEAGKAELERTVARRLRAAEDQIASAEAAAIRQVRNQAIAVAIAAATEVMRARMTEAQAEGLIDGAIKDTTARLQ
ncbi:MAG: ATP F0F1 synthase subunit B [Pseudomonadota bacterium]